MPLERVSRLTLLVKDNEALLLDEFKKYCNTKFGENQVTNRIMAMIYREMQNAKSKDIYKSKS